MHHASRRITGSGLRIGVAATGALLLTVGIATTATSSAGAATPTTVTPSARTAVPPPDTAPVGAPQTALQPATTSTSATPELSSTPAAYTPFLVSPDSTIRQLIAIKSTVYAVGTFSQVGRPNGHTFTRHNVFAFNAATGAISSWAPATNDTIYAATPSADGKWLYLGGAFTKSNGVAVDHLVKVSTSTGHIDRRFQPRADGVVETLRMHRGHLIVGGKFTWIGGAHRVALASLNQTTGNADSYLRLGVSGSVSGTDPGPTRVVRVVRNHAENKLIAMGNFTSVAGHSRRQIFVVDLGRYHATLDAWNPPQFHQPCSAKIAQYVRAAAWGPKDARIAVAATGGSGRSLLCDSVALYATGARTSEPLWVNHTGCDSLYSVAMTQANVYVGGHQRWLDNTACNKAGAYAVSRPGIGEVSQGSGLATPWNPTRSRGIGADDMLLTSRGLWVASDNWYDSTSCGGAYHPGLCLFPPA